MKSDQMTTEEQRAKEEAYREYLRLRQESQPDRAPQSVTGTPYGASDLRRKSKEAQDLERQRQEYLRARADAEAAEADRKRSRASRRADRKAERKAQKASYGKPPGKNRGLRIALIVLLVLVLGLGTLTVGAFAVAASTLGKMGHVDVDREEISISSKAADRLSEYTNIAVLGVDARDVKDDSDSRSDAIVIVSINNETNEVKMFSVYRDTLLDLSGDVGLDKITHAYFYGGAQDTLKALNKNLDLNISRVVVVNWKTVAEVIDTLGGIKINVKESEIEELNKYVGGTAKTTGSKKKKVKHAGKQTLNGAQAVTYARIRKDAATGDYRRNERMKIVMKKTFKKAKKADIFTLKKICDNAFPQAKTNISTSEMMSMALSFKKYDMTSTTTGWPYDVAGWMGYAGAGYAWYGPPVTLASNVEELHEDIFEDKNYEPSDTVESISNDIVNLTGLY